jgi:hypothetical protein
MYVACLTCKLSLSAFRASTTCILHQPHPGQSPTTLCIVLSLNHVVFALASTALPSHAVPHLYFSFHNRFTLQIFAQQANHSLRYFNLILDPGPDAPNLHMYRH